MISIDSFSRKVLFQDSNFLNGSTSKGFVEYEKMSISFHYHFLELNATPRTSPLGSYSQKLIFGFGVKYYGTQVLEYCSSNKDRFCNEIATVVSIEDFAKDGGEEFFSEMHCV